MSVGWWFWAAIALAVAGCGRSRPAPCNDLGNDGPLVAPAPLEGDPLGAAGGDLAPGTYQLVRASQSPAVSPATRYRRAIRFSSDGRFDWVIGDRSDQPLDLRLSGTALTSR